MINEIIVVPGKKLQKNNELDFRGKQRVRALLQHIFSTQNNSEHIIFSGSRTGSSEISEAEVMFKFFIENLTQKINTQNNLIIDGVEQQAYSVTLENKKKYAIILEKDARGSYENMENTQLIVDSITKNMNWSKKQTLVTIISQNYHVPRLYKLCSQEEYFSSYKLELKSAEKILEEPLENISHKEYIYYIITKFGLDRPGSKKEIWYKIKQYFGGNSKTFKKA